MKRLRLLKLCFTAFALFAILLACTEHKPISLAGDKPVPVSDFIAFFQELKPPYVMGDTVLAKKEKDSLLIGYKVFTSVVPDSVLTLSFGKGVKPKLYAIGKVQVPKAESYLIVKGVAHSKSSLLILAFDKKNNFIAWMPALKASVKAGLNSVITIDRKFVITRSTNRKNADASLSEGKEVYILNEAAKTFMLILTEALEDKVTELINPIDTLPRKSKYAGDYGSQKMDLVSVRDGRKADRISFFVHFEKKEGACIGELKGEAFWRTPTKAEYRQDGDPCVLQFTFTGSSVSLKEQNCGSRRGPDCVFDGQFIKKKTPKNRKKQRP
jgi:hypothetical protein